MLVLAMLLQTSVANDPGAKVDLTPIVLQSTRSTLADPESARDLRMCEPRLAKDSWVYMYSYRAKNALGGYIFSGYATLVRNGVVTGTIGGTDAIGQSMLSMTGACPMVDASRLAEAMK